MSAAETETITTFGGYLRFLRRRARLTQTELGIAVGYSPGQISMLENGQRLPNATTIAALFVPALGIEDDDQRRHHLLALANDPVLVSSPQLPAELEITQAVVVTREEIGQLEAIPWVPGYAVQRLGPLTELQRLLEREHAVVLCGMGGMGKTTLAAQFAGAYAAHGPVFWMTCTATGALLSEQMVRQLALFAATQLEQPQRLNPILRPPPGATPASYAQQLAMLLAVLLELETPLLVFDEAQLVNSEPQAAYLISLLHTRLPACRLVLVAREELAIPGLFHQQLGGLERDELALLQSRLAQRPGIDLERLHRQTSGSPMLARLAMSYWEQHSMRNPAMPFPVASYLIDSVLNTLPRAPRRLLDLLALWQGPLDLSGSRLGAELAVRWRDYDHGHALAHLQRSRIIEHLELAQPHPLLREPLLIALDAQPEYARQVHQVAAQVAAQQRDHVRAAYHLCEVGEIEAACALVDGLAAEPPLPGQATVLAATVENLIARVRGQQPAGWNETLCQLLILQGDLLINTTRAEQAQASYYEALERTLAPADHARLAEKIATCAYRRGAFDEALDLCDEASNALGMAVSKDAIALRMQIEATRIRILITLARFDEARQICETALAFVRPVALVLPGLTGTVRAYANLTLGYIARFQGDNVVARQYFHKAIQQARAVKAAHVEADALQYLSSVLRDLGDMAGEIGLQALELAHAAGNEYLMSSILHHLSLTDYFRGDLERALWRTRRVLQLKLPMGDIEGVVASRMVQAIVLAAQGDVQQAWEAAAQGGRDCDLMENTWLRGIADYGHAVVLSFTDDLAAAEHYLLRALATTMLKRDIPFYTGAQIYLAMVYVAQGRLLEADAIIRPALPTGAGYSAELLRELVRGMWLLASGCASDARRCAEHLITQAKQSGFLIYEQEASRLAVLANDPPPLARLPRLVCCPTPGALSRVQNA